MPKLENRIIRLERILRDATDETDVVSPADVKKFIVEHLGDVSDLNARVSALERTNLLLSQALEKVSHGTRFAFHKEGRTAHLDEVEN